MASRYFVDTLPPPGPFRLEGELAHHLGTVLRARPGHEVLLADGRGHRARAGIVAVDRHVITLEVGAADFEPRPATAVHLAFAPPRRTRAEWLFEHATEVGVAVFWPLATTRARPQSERLERWDRIARAAAGQCDRSWLPEVRPLLEFADFLSHPELPTLRFVADREGEPLAAGAAGDAILLVGPEGGFTPAEREAAAAAGFEPCRLGPHVLRSETAALVGAAQLVVLQ